MLRLLGWDVGTSGREDGRPLNTASTGEEVTGSVSDHRSCLRSEPGLTGNEAFFVFRVSQQGLKRFHRKEQGNY